MSRVRVLQVIWRLSRAGGAQSVARGFLKHFDRSVLDVHVCTMRPLFDEDQVDEVGHGITYHPLNLVGRPSPLVRARAMTGVAHVASAIRPTVLHVHGGTGWLSLPAARASRDSVRILEVHDAPQSGRMSRVNQVVERCMTRHLAFHTLVHSTAVRRDVVSAWRLDPDDVAVLPLGIDLEDFRSDRDKGAAARSSLGVDSDAPLVTYVGRLVPEKRPELFLEVARRILERRPSVTFALVGDGSSRETARARARELGISRLVRIPGFVDDLAGLYNASDVFLSTSRYEGFGLAIAEAMADGVPVVATRVGGVDDVVGDAGILERSDCPDLLAGHVLALLDDPDRRAALAHAGAARARSQLDVRETARGFERYYRALAS